MTDEGRRQARSLASALQGQSFALVGNCPKSPVLHQKVEMIEGENQTEGNKNAE